MPSLSTRQSATGLSDANKVLTRCAWLGNTEFVARYGSAWSGLGACPYVFTSKSSLKTAAQAYNANVATATAGYGPIAGWDVSAITDMSELFQSLNNFNADISSWDTSSVTTMSTMFRVRSARAPASRLRTWVTCLHAACAAAAPTPSRVPARLSPLFLCLPFRLGSPRRRSTSR
jgi:surface protein